MTYKKKKALYDFHKENSGRIEDERIAQQHNFDTWILRLCGGSFAVSFAFIERLVDFSVAVLKPVLVAGWLCFSLCLCLSVYSFLNTEKACRLAFLQEWEQYRNETENAGIKSRKNYRNIISVLINNVCFTLFLSGVLCVIIFLFINI